MKTKKHTGLFNIILCFALLFCHFSVYTEAETVTIGKTEELDIAVYAFSEYKITLRNAVYASGGKDDGVMLTDRKYTLAYDEDKITQGWVMIRSYDQESDYRATVDIDIGYTAKGIDNFYLRAYKNLLLNAEMPDKIRFYVSNDGENYDYIGTASTMTDLSAESAAAVYSIQLGKVVTARYIRAVIDCAGSGVLWLNEVGASAKGNLLRVNSASDGLIYDEQGLVYEIEEQKAVVSRYSAQASGQGGIIKPSDDSFNTDGTTYVLGEHSNNPVTVISDFIGTGRPNYSGVPNNIKYIVIHNTGTTEEETDAERYNYRMHTTDGETSWHYTVDDKVIYHSLADSIVGWHAGSDKNYESIGIEICTNGAPTSSSGKILFSGSKYDNWVDTKFRQALKNTAMLTAELLTRYGLDTDAVIQHYDVTEKNCPLWLRAKNGKFVYEGTLWVEFMGYVEEYYSLINGKNPKSYIHPKSDIVVPDYISTSDGRIYPITEIGANAFCDKGELISSITIGKMVEYIAPLCFDGSDGLESVTVSAENLEFYSDSEGVLYNKNGQIVFDCTADFPAPSPKEGHCLDIRELGGRYYIFIDTSGHTLNEIAEEYGATEFKAVSINGGILENDDFLFTGTAVTLDGARLYIIISGDADGDGEIGVSDYVLTRRTYMGTYLPMKRQIPAMALNNKEKVLISDYVLITRHVMGTYVIK